MEAELVPARVRDCACPGTPHPDGDEVYLLPRLSLEGGAASEMDLIAVQSIKDEQRRGAALIVRWTRTFVEYGAVGWNWLDEEGPVPFDVSVLLADYSLSKPVAEKANDLYQEEVLAPLLAAGLASRRKSSRSGPTASVTSPNPAPTPLRRRSSSGPSTAGRRSAAVR